MHAERDRDGDAEQLPPALVAVAAEHEDADQHREELHQLQHRVHEQHPRVEPAPGHVRRTGAAAGASVGLERRVRLAHVASPASASVRRVRSSTSRSATGLSIALIRSGPAAEAVVTVTDARPKARSIHALLEVDGLHPRHRRDPPLPAQPAGLRVDRRVGALPAVDPVAHLRHEPDVGARQHHQRRVDPPRHVEPEHVRRPPAPRARTAHRMAAPTAQSTGALAETWCAGSRSAGFSKGVEVTPPACHSRVRITDMDADVIVVGSRPRRSRRHRRARRRGQEGAAARPGAGAEPRRPGVLVARRALPRRHPRAAADGRQGLLRARPPGLDGQRAVRPRERLLAASLGRGVRRLRRRREAPVAPRPGAAGLPGGRLGRARRRSRRRSRQLGAALPPHLGHRSRRGRAVRAPGARGGREGPGDVQVPAPRRRPGQGRRHRDRRTRGGCSPPTTWCAARSPTATRPASSSTPPRP